MDTQTINLLVANAIFAWLIQRLKGWAALPWITHETEKINHVASALAATLLAAGIALTSDWNAQTHTFVLTISGLSAVNVVHFIWSALGNYILQKGWFKVLYAQPNGKNKDAVAELPKAI